MRMMELSEDERPREKMRDRGLSALTNAELLAVLLRTGTGGRNAMDIARDLLASSDGSLRRLSAASPAKMCAVPGIGFGKAASVCAAFELGRRCAAELSATAGEPITTPHQACGIMLPRFRVLEHEECWALFLNRRNRPVGTEMISSGGLAETTIDSRMVAGAALEKKAVSVILFHNHPSGSPEPGNADIRQTARLKAALDSLDIRLIDHIIIAGDSFYSFSEESSFRLRSPEK